MPTAVSLRFTKLDSECERLQAEACTFGEARLLFDACIKRYGVVADYLAPNARILHSPAFEAAVLKLSHELPLSTSETAKLEAFIASIPARNSSPDDEGVESAPSTKASGLKHENGSGQLRYMCFPPSHQQ